MNTAEFIQTLRNAEEKEMKIEYRPDEFVPAAFHITEVKNVHIDSVDCGGKPDSYDQTVIQLWWDGLRRTKRSMTAAKAVKILDIVNQTTALKGDTDLFLEWGHGDLPPSHYRIKNVEETENSITFRLYAPPTVCKPVQQLKTLGGNCCTPGGGCC